MSWAGTAIRRSSVTLAVAVIGFSFANGVSLSPAVADDTPPTSEQVEFFESKVRPILVEHCYECHSVDAEDLEAGLVLDSKWGWQTGGDSGPAIVPGNLDDSLLIEAVRYEENVVSGMPPRSKLPDAKIKVLEQWVAMGAPDPRAKATPKSGLVETFDLQSRFQEHWSWRPVERPTPPEVSLSDWPLNEIDHFVLARLERAGFVPAEDADKRIWLRRVYLDLIGLPPTPEQIDRFMNDDSAESHQRVVDELLRSPHFGEQWARHWMDLVRYAETYGHEFDYPINHAYQYRDYLIRAFNADVPFDQFAREHIAGDLLPQPRRHPESGFNESVIGTGFWYFHEATHAPTDVLGNEADIVDNQLDVFGKAFLGLTVACARCHDHKFDAISTADYYALSAYLQSSCRQEIALDDGGKVAELTSQIEALRLRARRALQRVDWKTEVDRRPGRYYEAAAALLRAVNAKRPLSANDPAKVTAESVAKLAAEQQLDPDKLRRWVDHFRDIVAAIESDSTSSEPSAPENATVLADFDGEQLPEGWTTSGRAFQPVGEVLQVSASGGLARPGTVSSGLSGRMQTGILRSPTFEITGNQIHVRMRGDANLMVRVVIDNYYMAHYNALLFKGTFLNDKETDTNGRWAWKTLGRDLRKYVGHRAYLEFIDDGNETIELDRIVMTNQAAPDGNTITMPTHAAFADQKWRESIEAIRSGRSSALMSALVDAELISLDQLHVGVRRWLDEASKLADQLPSPQLVVAMAEGTTEHANVYIRGSHTNLGPEVPPRFLEAFGGRVGNRLTLADEVANPDNPLTARVLVNRLWHHLFGRGIVASVDDFGPQGQPPSHPELLDWMASEFVRDDWSIKSMLRKITLSHTYRQSSIANPSLSQSMIATVDPNNELLHRMPVRRLPAESIRDAILVVAGTLDPKQFGPSIATHRTPFMTGRGARASGPLDGDRRRSIYLSVYRNFLNPFMLTFDTPSPFGPQGRRSRSNVPAQALTMMNDPFIVDQSAKWAEQVSGQDSTARERIVAMVRRAHGVEPSDDQIASLEAFLDQQAQIYGQMDQRVWTDLAHALFNMKAFYFVQ